MHAELREPGRGISVVLPVFRNRPQLPELLDRIMTVLDTLGSPWEIVFVDDCGADGSREWIEARILDDDRLRLVVNPANLGQHAAVLAGLLVARGDRIVVMDADLQDAPEDVPALLGALGPEAAAVFARRRTDARSGSRRWTGRVFKSLLRRITGSHIPAGTGMFLVLGGDIRAAALRLARDHPYLPLLLARTGLPLAAVDVARLERASGESAYTWHRRLRMGLRVMAQALRLKLFGR